MLEEAGNLRQQQWLHVFGQIAAGADLVKTHGGITKSRKAAHYTCAPTAFPRPI